MTNRARPEGPSVIGQIMIHLGLADYLKKQPVSNDLIFCLHVYFVNLSHWNFLNYIGCYEKNVDISSRENIR